MTFGLLIVFILVWWVAFFAVLPFGVRRRERVAPGHDPGAPAQTMLWRKAALATAIAILAVGAGFLADRTGLIDIRAIVSGNGAAEGGG